MNHTHAIGIDVGGTNCQIALVSRDGLIVDRQLLSMQFYQEGAETLSTFLNDLNQSIQQMLTEHAINPQQVRGIGMGIPTGNIYNGTINNAANLPWHGHHPVAEQLHAISHLPVKLTNDANAATQGEMLYGAARFMRHFIFITLGTGIGSGIVVNGQIVYGVDGNAGELGHIIVRPEGRPCGCGRKGCLETYASANGIVNTARELLNQSDTPSTLRHIDPQRLSAKEIYLAAKEEDTIALDTYRQTAEILGESLANFITFTSPEAIILFGGVTNSSDLFLPLIEESMRQHTLSLYKPVPVLCSSLDADDAPLLGAAALTWQNDH